VSDNLAKVTVLARRLRQAIEAVPRDALPFGMREFPAGSCGDAAQLLAAYLSDSGFPGFEYVLGSRGSKEDGMWTSHAWIEREGMVVDITADQFADAPPGATASYDSPWHRGFDVEHRYVADFREWHGSGVAELGQLYARLRPVLF